MMVAMTTPSLLQALIGGDAAAAPAQPAANAAEFAALIAGLGVTPLPPEALATAAAGASDAASDDPAGDLPQEGSPADGRAADDGDPLAAALAALPGAVAQAIAPPADGAAQTPAVISADARAAAASPPPAQPIASDPRNAAPTAAAAPDGADGADRPKHLTALLALMQPAAVPSGTADEATTTDAAEAAAPTGPQPHAPRTTPPPADRNPATAPPAVTAALASDDTAARAEPRSRTAAKDEPSASIDAADAPAAPAIESIPQAAAVPPHHGAAVTDPAGAAAPAQQTLAHALAERHLAITSDGQWLDQLARDIAQSASIDGKMRFQLNPEHLGSLHVEVTRGPEGAAVRLTADSEAARAILADAQPQLVAEARIQGVRIAETHVDLGGHGAGREAARQQPAPALAMVRTAAAAETRSSASPATADDERYA